MGIINNVRNMFAKRQPPATTTGTVEKGIAGARTPRGSYAAAATWDEELPSLLTLKGINKIDEMRLDDALGAYIDMKKSARLCTDYKFAPASDAPEDVLRADFLTEVESRMDGSLKQALREVLSAMEYGYSVTNKPLYIMHGGDFDGKIGIRALKTKEPHNYRFELDEFRNVTALLHQRPTDAEYERLNVNEFIIYTYRREFSNPYGKSDYLRAYRAWNSKRHILRMWDMFLERYAGGFLDISYIAGKQDPQSHEEMISLIEDIQTPRTGSLHSDVYTVNLVESTGRGSDVFQAAVAQRNIFMARAVLIPDLLGFSQQPGGAYALGKKHFDVFLQVIEDLGRDIEETVMYEQFIKPLIDLNFPGTIEYPRFKFEPLSDEQKQWVVASMISAIQHGAVTPDENTENLIREMLDAPKREEGAGIDDGAQSATPAEKPITPRAPENEDTHARTVENNAKAVALAAPSISTRAEMQRAPDEHEAKVDLHGLARFINEAQPVFISQWEELFETAQSALLKTLRTGRIIEDKDWARVEALRWPRRADLEKTLTRYMLSAYYFGALMAQREVYGGGPVHFAADPKRPYANMPLDEIDKYFKSKGLTISPSIKRAATAIKREAFYVTGMQTEQSLARVKVIIAKGIRRGDLRWTEQQLKKLFDGMIKRGVITDKALGELYRIETIARTNFTTAVNEGRLRMFEDPDVVDMIVAYKWSAILDDATTEYCRAMDAAGPMPREEMLAEGFPPAHFNCRSLVVPITKGERHKIGKLPRGADRSTGFEMLGDVMQFSTRVLYDDDLICPCITRGA